MNEDGLLPDETVRLGLVVSGSLQEGLRVRLDGGVSVEEVRAGRLVAIQGQRQRLLGLIDDVGLEAIDQRLTVTPPDVADSFIAEVVAGTGTFGTLHIRPRVALGIEGPEQVKTVPPHFAVVREALASDVELAFGKEDAKHFWVGNPLDMEVRLHLDLGRLVERSSGVFGMTGTGKTFLTRILLAGILQKRAAVSLIFDMHHEYGWVGSGEGGLTVKGLKQLFPSQVAVFTLDEESSRRRVVSTDFVVEIGYDEVEPEDIAVLAGELNLTERGMDALHELVEEYGKEWLRCFLDRGDRDVQADLKERTPIPVGVLRALRFSLNQLRRLDFLVPQARDNSVDRILEHLQRGKSVVLEFGRYGDNLLAYILVSAFLTRRIHDHYVKGKERAMGDRLAEPRPLLIVIEEAHKFLSPEAARQTIFGTIAREMRKYNVTLLVVDQRPSGIEPEVMSQIGTKVACHTKDEHDIESLLSGVDGKGELRRVLAGLETRQQALIFGHAVPMPVAFEVRDYGTPQSYREFGESRRPALDLWEDDPKKEG